MGQTGGKRKKKQVNWVIFAQRVRAVPQEPQLGSQSYYKLFDLDLNAITLSNNNKFKTNLVI